MPANLVRKEYRFIWSKDSMRYATIVFVATAPDKWDIATVRFEGVRKGAYTLDDWEFLGCLADEIKRLCKLEGVTL